jgi:hypothetical protein
MSYRRPDREGWLRLVDRAALSTPPSCRGFPWATGQNGASAVPRQWRYVQHSGQPVLGRVPCRPTPTRVPCSWHPHNLAPRAKREVFREESGPITPSLLGALSDCYRPRPRVHRADGAQGQLGAERARRSRPALHRRSPKRPQGAIGALSLLCRGLPGQVH